jgi:hypothetical protein
MTEQLKALLRDAHLSKRYDRTPRTINRWKYLGILPPADLTIAGQDYWYPETIEANERERFSTKPSGAAAGSTSEEPISPAVPRPTPSRPAGEPKRLTA